MFIGKGVLKLLCNFIEITFQHGCSLINLLHIFKTSFYKNTCGRLLPTNVIWNIIWTHFNPGFSLYRNQLINLSSKSRSSRPEVFCKKGVARNFAKFTGKRLCQRFFYNKVAGLRPATLLKKNFWHRCFPVNFAKFFRTIIL